MLFYSVSETADIGIVMSNCNNTSELSKNGPSHAAESAATFLSV